MHLMTICRFADLLFSFPDLEFGSSSSTFILHGLALHVPFGVVKAESCITGHLIQESDSEIEGLYDAEDEHENDLEAPVEPETVVKKPREPSLFTKETEEQLSKKELKKKELEAALAELGLQKEPRSQADSHVLENSSAEKKVEDRNGELEKKENATSESKNAKKKKDKSSKEQKESQNLPDSVADGKTTTETAGTGKAEDAPVTDVKERHKKVASVKKKKSRRWMLLLGVQGLPWQREKIRRLTTISSLCGKQADKWQSTCIFSLFILLFWPLYFQSFHYHIWAYALCSFANAK
ncbi:uncharacterized protein LOC107615209 [Arachis ipaensis]|uniref:uncharacterized protein LOC107615209 n=1 Tax=Arachis ipaensis TaxID=130454 RepID=UPI000A2B37FB|nr:uncharacterized protein LOC107615209 [Arachis ipaensis]